MFIEPASFESVLRFLATEACLDPNENVRAEAHTAAITLIKSRGKTEANTLLALIEKFLEGVESISDEPLKQLYEIGCGSQNETVLFLSCLANYLEDISAKKLLSTFEVLISLLSKSTTPYYVQ